MAIKVNKGAAHAIKYIQSAKIDSNCKYNIGTASFIFQRSLSTLAPASLISSWDNGSSDAPQSHWEKDKGRTFCMWCSHHISGNCSIVDKAQIGKKQQNRLLWKGLRNIPMTFTFGTEASKTIAIITAVITRLALRKNCIWLPWKVDYVMFDDS